MPNQTWAPPAPPAEPVQEGARWRWHRPTSEQVASWFGTQPLDEGMEYAHYIGGVVLIPGSEKVKYTRPDGGGTVERYETVYAPYMQIGTRIAYARRLAEGRELIYHAEPADVPRSTNPNSIYFNGHMDKGLWWHVVVDEHGQNLRYLCATWNVGLYDRTSFAQKYRGEQSLPLLWGHGTKQVAGGPDPNGIAKAQTGAIGRALGVAGILVIGTGIATAEDMMELPGYGASQTPEPELPPTTSPTELAQGEPPAPQTEAEALEALRAQAMALQVQMQSTAPPAWQEFANWWKDRAAEEGWSGLNDVPFEALRGVVSRMERLLAEAQVETSSEEASV